MSGKPELAIKGGMHALFNYVSAQGIVCQKCATEIELRPLATLA